MDLWVVGAGGLLGSAVVRRRPPGTRVHRAAPVPWHTAGLVDAALADAFGEFRRQREPGRPWAVVWAAGTGVVSSDPGELLAQESTLLRLAGLVAQEPDPDGTFLFASSAAVFGAQARLYDESDTARPVSPYGVAKLRQEDALRDVFAAPDGPRLAVARLSTLFGPGQNLAKRQGLVSSMCLEAVRGGVITLHVPLDTTRDYLYADDAGALVHTLLDVARTEPAGAPVTRVLASHRTTTVGEVARLVQSVVHRRTHIVQASTPTTVHQRHQAVQSSDPRLAALPRTPLPVGVHRVHQDVLRRWMTGAATAR